MTEIRVRLPELLSQRQINRKQLSEQTGLRYATVSDLYTGRRKPNLDTLQMVLEGLEQLTGQPVEITDLLEVVRAPAPHGDPDRPALDLTNLKTFRRSSSPVRPSSPTDSAATVASLRGRES